MNIQEQEAVAEAMHELDLIELAKVWGREMGKFSVDQMMEAAMDQCKVKKKRRPHVKRVLQAFVALTPKCYQANPRGKSDV